MRRCGAGAVANLVEQLDAANLLGDLLGKHRVGALALDLDFAVVRHDCGCWCVGGLEVSCRAVGFKESRSAKFVWSAALHLPLMLIDLAWAANENLQCGAVC